MQSGSKHYISITIPCDISQYIDSDLAVTSDENNNQEPCYRVAEDNIGGDIVASRYWRNISSCTLGVATLSLVLIAATPAQALNCGRSDAYDRNGQCAVRNLSRDQCGSLSGEFQPDRGAGYSLCLYAPRSSGGRPAAGGGQTTKEWLRENLGGDSPSGGGRPVPHRRDFVAKDLSGPGGRNFFDLTLCNKTGTSISAATASYAGSSYTIEGWWRVEPGSCRQIGRFAKRSFQIYAHSATGTWGGQNKYCIASTVYHRVNTSNYNCKPGEQLRGFKPVSIQEATQKHTLNLE